MQTFNDLFEHQLKKLIERTIEDMRDQLEVNSYEDMGQFKYVMGKIAAYRNVVNYLIDEAKEAADQRNR